jgi:hypothetical protein
MAISRTGDGEVSLAPCDLTDKFGLAALEDVMEDDRLRTGRFCSCTAAVFLGVDEASLTGGGFRLVPVLSL